MFQQLPKDTYSSIIVCVGTIDKKTAKTGKVYHTVGLIARDQSRQNVNFWDSDPTPPALGTIFRLRAIWTHGDYGLEAKKIQISDATPEEIDAFSQGFIRTESSDAKKVIHDCICHWVTDETCQALLYWLWQNHGLAYQRAAAARSNHQPYSGGLMEHTAAMLLLARGIIASFQSPEPQEHAPSDTLERYYKLRVNPSIIYTAIIFHDCGKIWENNYEPGPIPCTMHHNRLAEYHGHIAIGHTLILDAYREIQSTQSPDATHIAFAELPDIIHHLCHCILSHHGQLDWGSPVTPKTLEAHIVHTVDNLEAKSWMHANNIHKGEALPQSLHKSRGPVHLTISPI